MKSQMIVVIISAFLGSLIGTAKAADIRTCQIDRVSGGKVVLDTTTKQQQWTEKFKAVTGLNIPVTATVETGPASRVVLHCDDETIITVGPDTKIIIDDLVGQSGPERNILLQLLQGIVGIVAPNRNWNRLEVETSVAIASVRSTEWLVESRTKSGTAVFVTVGSVDVFATDQSYVLMPGEGVTVQDPKANEVNAVIPEVKRWGEKRIAKSRSALGFDWE